MLSEASRMVRVSDIRVRTSKKRRPQCVRIKFGAMLKEPRRSWKPRNEMDWKHGVAVLQRLQQPNVQARMVTGVTVLLVLALAYALAQFTWLLVPGVTAAMQVPPPVPSAPPGVAAGARPTTTAADEGKTIAALHLFGRADLIAAVPKQEPVVETTLQLELRGIFSSNDPSLARAIIAEPSRDEKPYAAGATDIPGGATLKEIRDDHVVLSRSGRLEILRLPKDKLGTGSVESISPPEREVELEPPLEEPPREFTGGESLRDLRDAVINDPQLLAGFLQAEPVQGPSGIEGFRLGSGQDPQLLRRFGLQRGDVVMAVNDVQLNGVTKVPQLLQSLPGASELTIKFRRNGKDRSVTLNLQ